MGAVPRGLLASICTILLVVVVAAHAATEPAETSMVVGLAKCADCTRKNMNAEAVFMGLHVAVKCKNANGEFETKAVAEVDKSGAFSVPLASDLVRQDDGQLKQDCFAQLHTAASHQPCPGQEPSWIVRPPSSSHDDKKEEMVNFVAVAGKVHFSSKECASAFLCDHPFLHKKHHLLHKKPTVVIPPHVVHKKPAVVAIPPHVHKKPAVVIPHVVHTKPPVPEYTPHPTPVPTYKPPTPEYSHHPSPTPIYHPPAEEDQKTVSRNAATTDPEMFKKLLPFIKKKPFFFPKFKKFPPGKVDIKA